jgi:hypothetical protein
MGLYRTNVGIRELKDVFAVRMLLIGFSGGHGCCTSKGGGRASQFLGPALIYFFTSIRILSLSQSGDHLFSCSISKNA